MHFNQSAVGDNRKECFRISQRGLHQVFLLNFIYRIIHVLILFKTASIILYCNIYVITYDSVLKCFTQALIYLLFAQRYDY